MVSFSSPETPAPSIRTKTIWFGPGHGHRNRFARGGVDRLQRARRPAAVRHPAEHLPAFAGRDRDEVAEHRPRLFGRVPAGKAAVEVGAGELGEDQRLVLAQDPFRAVGAFGRGRVQPVELRGVGGVVLEDRQRLPIEAVGPGGGDLPRFDRDRVAAEHGELLGLERVERLQRRPAGFDLGVAAAGVDQVPRLVPGEADVVGKIDVGRGPRRPHRNRQQPDADRHRQQPAPAPAAEADRQIEDAEVGEEQGDVGEVGADDALLVDRKGGERGDQRSRPSGRGRRGSRRARRRRPGPSERTAPAATARVTFQGAHRRLPQHRARVGGGDFPGVAEEGGDVAEALPGRQPERDERGCEQPDVAEQQPPARPRSDQREEEERRRSAARWRACRAPPAPRKTTAATSPGADRARRALPLQEPKAAEDGEQQAVFEEEEEGDDDERADERRRQPQPPPQGPDEADAEARSQSDER